LKRRKRFGISEVVSTAILIAVILISVILAFGYATYVIGIQNASNEFSQDQGITLSFENMIGGLIYTPDSSAFIQYNFRTSGPSFDKTGNNITLAISQQNGPNYTPLAAKNASIAVFRIKGGSNVATVNSNLVGNSSILLTDASQSIGRVTVNQSQGAWVSLDYARVRINYLGISTFYNGTGLEEFNVVEVTYLNLTRGKWFGGSLLTISARNSAVLSYQLPVFGMNKQITFTTTGGWPTSQSASKTLTGLGGDLTKRTIVRVVFAEIVITVGGS